MFIHTSCDRLHDVTAVGTVDPIRAVFLTALHDFSDQAKVMGNDLLQVKVVVFCHSLLVVAEEHWFLFFACHVTVD